MGSLSNILCPPQREYILGFLRWGDPQCEPTYRDAKVHARTMHTDVEMLQILPSGTIPEEERAAQLFTTDVGPKKDLGPARYGKGPAGPASAVVRMGTHGSHAPKRSQENAEYADRKSIPYLPLPLALPACPRVPRQLCS